MFVGDMVHDIETAKHGGVFSVATLTGYDPPERLAAASPDLTVSDLAGLKRSADASMMAKAKSISRTYGFDTVGVPERSGRAPSQWRSV